MDLDQLKNTWKEFDRRLERLEDESRRAAERVAQGKVRSGQQKLAASYRLNAVLGPVGACAVFFCAGLLHLPAWLTVALLLFFLGMGALSLIFCRRVARHDFLGEPSVKAVAYALKLRRQRIILCACGILAGAVLLAAFFFVLARAEMAPAIWGAAIGLVLGGVGGYLKFRRQSRLLRELTSELEEMGN